MPHFFEVSCKSWNPLKIAWLVSCGVLFSSVSWALPPLPSSTVPPIFQPPSPPTQQDEDTRFHTPFAQRILKLGRKLNKRLPRGWNMQWSLTQMRDIGWFASHEQGYRIRFVHHQKTIFVPLPFPQYTKGSPRTKKVPLRCSLHFFPRKGVYRAQESLIDRVAPAKTIAVLEDMVVLQPNRFFAMEYPCPGLVRQFLSSVGLADAPTPYQTHLVPHSKKRWFQSASLFKHHLSVKIKGTRRLPWRRWLRKAKVKTILLTRQQSHLTTYELRSLK